MASITLADYIGFIFSEITRARDHADRVSMEVAKQYAKDDILKYFSVPRFKIPEMELTIPVLISGARFNSALEFIMPPDDFYKYIADKAVNAIKSILISKSGLDKDITKINTDIFIRPIFKPIVFKPIPRAGKENQNPLKADEPDTILKDFYLQLKNNPDPTHPELIIQVKWLMYFNKKLEEYKLMEEYKKQFPENQLAIKLTSEIVEKVKANTVITKTKITNLLVDPETNIVKNGSTDTTVFTIKAKIMEEGIFVKSITDDDSGKEKNIVEFE